MSSNTWNAAGKMPALPQHAAASLRHKSQPVRRQLEGVYSFKPRHYSGTRCGLSIIARMGDVT